MTVVVGTAGHIDHGKTSLLRALTGIDADRLPEERRRGMTIDVGYAHLGLPGGSELDFVDVPGHDRLVGNMLVGAGEIDAVMLVVAADDGPRAQTIEHLELLDALGIVDGIAVVTKTDVAGDSRVAEVRRDVQRLLAGTSLAGSPVLAASSVDGSGIAGVLAALIELRDRVLARDHVGRGPLPTGSRLAIDRVFSVKGRGLVVTGTLRGTPLEARAMLRLVPGEVTIRARELQVHGRGVVRAERGRTAINVAGLEGASLERGMVLTDDPAVVASDRLLVLLGNHVPDRTRARVHLGTASGDGTIGRAGWDAIDLPGVAEVGILRLAAPIAVAPGDRFVLRRVSGVGRVIGGTVLDVMPPRGISRRRQSPDRVAGLALAIEAGYATATTMARLDLHGAVRGTGGRIALAADVADAARIAVLDAIEHPGSASDDERSRLGTIRALAARALQRRVALGRADADTAAAQLVDQLIADGRLVRDGQHLRSPGRQRGAAGAEDPAIALAMDRVERLLDVPAPPSLAEAARVAGCPPAGIHELTRSGRIVSLDADLAYAASAYRALEATALQLAAVAPLTPATLRDATSTSRKYVMAILADLDRRGILRRTDAGHVPGPRAATAPVAVGRPESGG
jgi:selenocysteine-specific elongation factor